MSEGGGARNHEPDCWRNERNTVWGHREWLPPCTCGEAKGEARNHEAEVEAVARAMFNDHGGEPYRSLGWEALSESFRDWWRERARVAIAALDAVRRSPQDEDHEAGIEAALQAVLDGPLRAAGSISPDTMRSWLEPAIAAYLSRCPPPERNTEKRVSQDHDPGRTD